MNPPTDHAGNEGSPVSRRAKRQLWFGAWAAVTFAGMVPHPAQLLLAPFFPVGLFALLPHGEEKAITGWMLGFPCFFGWGVYAFLSIILFQARKVNVFVLFYAVFLTLLALNVAGCKIALGAAAGIR